MEATGSLKQKRAFIPPRMERIMFSEKDVISTSGMTEETQKNRLIWEEEGKIDDLDILSW